MDIDALIRPEAPPVPRGLRRSGAGRRLWAGIVGDWRLTPAELTALRLAVVTLDEIERMRAELGHGPYLVVGGRGAKIAHPLLDEIRRHQAALEALLDKLGIEEIDGSEASHAGRALVGKRWARRRG